MAKVMLWVMLLGSLAWGFGCASGGSAIGDGGGAQGATGDRSEADAAPWWRPRPATALIARHGEVRATLRWAHLATVDGYDSWYYPAIDGLWVTAPDGGSMAVLEPSRVSYFDVRLSLWRRTASQVWLVRYRESPDDPELLSRVIMLDPSVGVWQLPSGCMFVVPREPVASLLGLELSDTVPYEGDVDVDDVWADEFEGLPVPGGG